MTEQFTSLQRKPAMRTSSLSYLFPKVLRGDAENVQTQRGLLHVDLKALDLQRLLLTAVTQLLDHSLVQVLRLVHLNRPVDMCCSSTYW